MAVEIRRVGIKFLHAESFAIPFIRTLTDLVTLVLTLKAPLLIPSLGESQVRRNIESEQFAVLFQRVNSAFGQEKPFRDHNRLFDISERVWQPMPRKGRTEGSVCFKP